MKEFTDYLHPCLSQESIPDLSSLGLAHLGDAVFELMVRSCLCLGGKVKAGDLHRAAVRRVSAPAQARMAATLLPMLTEEEQAVYRRGRNSAPHTIPKAATRAEYQAATALEALFGWLFLRGETRRLNELFERAMHEELPLLPSPLSAADKRGDGAGPVSEDEMTTQGGQ